MQGTKRLGRTVAGAALLLAALVLFVPARAHAGADLLVANNNDAGPGSLRDTIAAANAGDSIFIPAGVGTITLTSGQIAVTKDLTIEGAGASSTVISGNHASRVFCVRAPACPTAKSGPQPSLSLSNLTIADGKVTLTADRDGGGAIYTNGDLALSGVTMTGNTVSYGSHIVDGGGAIYSDGGSLTISGSTLGPGNSATSGQNAFTLNGGGAVYKHLGAVTIENSRIHDNSVTNDSGMQGGVDGGAGVFASRADVNLHGSTIDSNTATLKGAAGSANGGVGVFDDMGNVTVDGSHVDSNTLTLTDRSASSSGGAGIYAHRGNLTVATSTVSGNSMGLTGDIMPMTSGGAGVYSQIGELTLTDSTLADNKLALSANTGATQDGGAAAYKEGGPWTFTRTTFGPGNLAEFAAGVSDSQNGGGAFFNGGGDGSATNSTFAGNAFKIGGTGTNDGGGAIYGNGGSTQFTNVTVAGNTATGAPGGGILTEGTTRLENTILAGNTAPSGANCSAGLEGSFASEGHNLESASTCGFSASGDLTDTDPLLGPLDSNGGPTKTLALPPASPAVDAGGNSSCPSVDQRGVVRPRGAACDIGAYELVPPAPPAGGSSPASSAAPMSATPPGAKPKPTGVRLALSTLIVHGTFVTVPIGCPGTPCKGKVVLSASRTAAKRITLGSARFSIPGGRTGHVKVKLTRAARKLLARKRRVKALVTVTASSKPVTKKVVLKLATKPKRR